MDVEEAMQYVEGCTTVVRSNNLVWAANVLAAEVRRLQGATKHMTTIDGAIVQPTDTVWVAGQSTVSKFYVANDWTVPLAVCDDAGEGWHDLPVSKCYSTRAAAEAARERGNG